MVKHKQLVSIFELKCDIVVTVTYVEKLIDSVILKVLIDSLNVIEVFGADTDLLHLCHDLVH